MNVYLHIINNFVFTDERNRHNIELLERCLCIVCIDDDVLPATFNNPYKKNDRWIGDRDLANVLHQILHGGGSRHLAANRWFDQTVQLILGKVIIIVKFVVSLCGLISERNTEWLTFVLLILEILFSFIS